MRTVETKGRCPACHEAIGFKARIILDLEHLPDEPKYMRIDDTYMKYAFIGIIGFITGGAVTLIITVFV